MSNYRWANLGRSGKELIVKQQSPNRESDELSVCDVTVHHPTPYAILAGGSIEFNITVHNLITTAATAEGRDRASFTPLNLSVSFNHSKEMMLIHTFLESASLRFTLHHFPPGTHHIYFLCQSSLSTSFSFVAASTSFLTLPVPLSPVPWWDGFTRYNREYTLHTENLLSKSAASLPLSLERRQDFIGVRFYHSSSSSLPLKKTLVAMFGSWSSQVFVDRNMRRFPESEFTVMLFIYDDSEWSHFPWFERVTSVRAKGQMKWWFIKRFLTPAVILEETSEDKSNSMYDYILLLDADVTISECDPSSFLSVLRAYDVWIGQPSHALSSQTTHRQLFQRNPHLVGEWTNFVESGPMLAFSVKIWTCIWNLLQNDIVVGFGYDIAWSSICAPNNTAVVHSHAIQHENIKEASSKENWMASSVAEGLVFFSRIEKAGFYPQSPGVFAPFTTLDTCNI